MDNFKKYINQHRIRLDIDEPSDHLFDSIEKRLKVQHSPTIPLFVKLAVAASIILLVGIAVYLFGFDSLEKSNEIAKTGPSGKIKSGEIFNKSIENKAPVTEEQLAATTVHQPSKREVINRSYAAAKVYKPRKEVPVKKSITQPADPILMAFNDMDKSYATMVNLQLEKVKGTPIYTEDAEYFHVFKKQFHDLSNDEKVLKEETKKHGINDDIINRMINIYQEKISLLKQLQFEINKMNNRMKTLNADIQKKQSPTYINL